MLLEAQGVGWGASGRNNGQVIPTLTAAEPDAWVARFGETGKRFAEMIGASAGMLFDAIREEGIVSDADAEQTRLVPACPFSRADQTQSETG